MFCTFQPLGGADDAHEIPHELADFAPALVDDDFLVTIRNPAFIPSADRRRDRQGIPLCFNIARRRIAEDKAFEQGIRGKPVRPVQARLRHFARSIKSRRIRAAIQIDQHPATGIMLSGHHGDRLFRNINPQPHQLFVDVGEMFADEFWRLVADIEMDIIQPQPLNLMINRPRHHIARGEFLPLVKVWHEAFAGRRQLKMPALPAHRFGNQEVLDLKIVEASRVELHEFHVRHAATRPPRHCDAIAGCAARCG